jgi:hypothetical protein
MSELYIDPSPCNSDTDADTEEAHHTILDIKLFESQPFSTCIDMSKPIYVYFGSGYEWMRNRETGSNIKWIRAEQHDAILDCMRHVQTCVCIVDSSFPTFRSLLASRGSTRSL